MLNKVEYWLELADDDMSVAKVLLDSKKFLHSGFFCHLIAEKALKAVIASVTSEVPPKTHDLSRLAERGGIFDNERCQESNVLSFRRTPQQVLSKAHRFPLKLYKCRLQLLSSF